MKTVTAWYEGNVFLTRVFVADRFFTRLRGLLFRRPLERNTGMLLKPCSEIHTFFMDYAIDAVFMDRSGRITRIEEKIPPSRIVPRAAGSRQVLELNAGEAGRYRLKTGGVIAFL